MPVFEDRHHAGLKLAELLEGYQKETQMEDKMRQAYKEKMGAQIKELEAQIAQIQAKAERVKAEAKVKYHKELEQLRGQQEKVQSQLQTLGEASGDAWNDLKSGVDEAFENLKDAVANALSRLEM